MSISVFLSTPRPYNKKQSAFLESLMLDIRSRGMNPRILGKTDYDMEAPLSGIRRLMYECCGLLGISFRRTFVREAVVAPEADEEGFREGALDSVWLTSPYAQIEPAMAFQLGLPILTLREVGVIADGVLEKGVTGLYVPEFDLTRSTPYLAEQEWKAVSREWEHRVRSVHRLRGEPTFR